MDKYQAQIAALRKRYLDIEKPNYIAYDRGYKRLQRKQELKEAWEHFKQAIKLLIH